MAETPLLTFDPGPGRPGSKALGGNGVNAGVRAMPSRGDCYFNADWPPPKPNVRPALPATPLYLDPMPTPPSSVSVEP
jgi:hypothetical protein